MAIYRLHAGIISRGKGQSAIASAAYRSAEKLKDDRLGLSFDYSGKRDVVHTEIMTPDNVPSWASDREKLWNKVEASEKFKTAQVAREIQLSLPEELTNEQQIALTREFVKEHYTDHGLAADISIHSKPGNPHAHVLLTMRTIDNQGFSKTKAREFNRKGALMEWRESWAEYASYHLAKAGHNIQIDHRSYADRGIDLEPQNKIGAGVHMRHHSALQRLADHQRIAKENGERIIADPNIALDALSRQQAVFTEHDIYKLAHRQSVDILQYRDVCKAIMGSKELVRLGQDKNGRDRFTTKQTIEMEKEMLSKGMDMAGRRRHPVERRYLRQARAIRTLTPDQDRAFEHVVRSGDLCCVVGYAGSGKGYTLGAVREAYEARGYRVMGTALAGIAADGLERESNIESRTIARLMIDIENNRERLTERDVLVVDEAGMVATRQMARLIDYAHQGHAKVVLVGSGQQLQPIEAGGPFRSFYHRLGAAEMTGIRRQEIDWQKECTKQLEGSEAGQALEMYRDQGCIHEHETFDHALNGLVEEWRKAQDKGSCTAVAFRNVDVEKINQRIRKEAEEIGRLKDGEREFQTIKGKRMFAPGDRILFLKNDARIGVKNGNFGEVERIRHSKMQVRLDEGSRIVFDAKDYPHINHGYAATTHKLQGVTVDRTVVLADPYFDRHATLVALSRHRADVSMHWSKESFKDFDHLKAALTRERPKQLAFDVGKEIHDFNAKRDDLFGKLDRGTGRARHDGLGRNGRTDGEKIDRNHQRDQASQRAGRGVDRPDRTEHKGGPPQRREPEPTSGGYYAGIEKGIGKTDVPGVSVVHGGGVGGLGRSAERIRGMAEHLFRESGSYEKARSNLRRAAEKHPIVLRRQLEELTESRNRGELERFKKEINFVEYAQTNGYGIDRRESSLNSKTMRHENGDKIVVSTDRDGQGAYLSVHNDKDGGSIIDFVQSRRGMNFKEARRELRPWIGLGRKPQRPDRSDPKPLPTVNFESRRMTRDFAATKSVERHAYLESRGVTANTLQDSRFKGMVREDKQGNAVFPHYNRGVLMGYEIKNNDVAGFSPGGEKGCWASNNFKTATKVVVVESAVDALSHAQLTRSGRETAYLSIGGELNRNQERLVTSLTDRAHRRGAEISIATDRTWPGERLAEKIKELSPKDAEIKRIVPSQGENFTEYLRIKAQSRDRSIQQDRGMSIGMSIGR